MVSFLTSLSFEDLSQMTTHGTSEMKTIPRHEISIEAPITNPEKIIGVGLNYKDIAKESVMEKPNEPVIFSKFPSSIIGDNNPIIIPKLSKAVDWEGELAVVIGKEGKHIQLSEATNHVVGYTIANDVTARDWGRGKNGGQILLAKSFDTFCPLGPVIVTKDDIPDPYNLRIRTYVNDSIVQDGTTRDMIFKIEECIAWVSNFCLLKPGDLILTGTPPGCGAWRNPPTYLKNGDVLRTAIEGIGEICNVVCG